MPKVNEMHYDKTSHIENQFYIGVERRHAQKPRRDIDHIRRHRNRTESLISECRLNTNRRSEDIDGFVEIPGLYSND